MAGLIDHATQRRPLRRATDADRDPADLTGPPLRLDQHQTTASTADRATTVNSAINNETASASDGAVPASRDLGAPVAPETRPDPHSTSSTRERGKPRRVGRPRGPERVQICTRILLDLDNALTEAVETTGLSVQPILEQALRDWFETHGYLDRTSRPRPIDSSD